MQAADADLMISHALLDRLKGDAVAVVDLFHTYGREPFDLADALRGLPRWNCRGGRRELERGVVAAQRAGYIEQLYDGRYRVITKELMTGAEYRADYPDAVWVPGVSWVNTP